MGESGAHRYPFFTNTDCPYFPCHEGLPLEEFNCLFCYCPLYALGDTCGGNFTYTPDGIKDCSACTVTHRGDAGTELVKRKWPELARLASKRQTTTHNQQEKHTREDRQDER
ncbi:MAG: cysteine-rich small domain-containing protein [Atopobiaceae bacterium]